MAKKALDRKTIMKSIEVFNQWLLEIDGGRIQLDDWLINKKITQLMMNLPDTIIWVELECMKILNLSSR